MQKQILKNKKLNSHKVTANSPDLRKNTFKPTYYANYSRVIYNAHDYKQLLLKRKHHRILRIECNLPYLFIENHKGLLELHKKLKNIKRIEVYAILFNHKISLQNLFCLLRKLQIRFCYRSREIARLSFCFVCPLQAPRRPTVGLYLSLQHTTTRN